MNYNPKIIQAIINSNYYLLVYYSENFFFLNKWYRKSFPLLKSINRYKFYLSWNAD